MPHLAQSLHDCSSFQRSVASMPMKLLCKNYSTISTGFLNHVPLPVYSGWKQGMSLFSVRPSCFHHSASPYLAKQSSLCKRPTVLPFFPLLEKLKCSSLPLNTSLPSSLRQFIFSRLPFHVGPTFVAHLKPCLLTGINPIPLHVSSSRLTLPTWTL